VHVTAYSCPSDTCEAEDIGLVFRDCSPTEIKAVAQQLSETVISVADMAGFVLNLRNAKYDKYVPDSVLRTLWARRNSTLMAPLRSVLQGIAEATPPS